MGNGVDAGGIETSIGQDPGTVVTMGLVWDDEIGQGQWYRISIALNTPENDNQPGDGAGYYVNPPGTQLTIISEQFGIQDDGQQYCQLTIRNDSVYAVPEHADVAVIFSLNVASTFSPQ